MRPDHASATAADNALVRALDARRPPGERVADDQLAVRLLPPRYRALVEAARVPPVRRLVEGVIDRWWPGPRRGVVARTRYIDELVTGALPEVDQVLLLGAGFDTRAHRLPGIDRVPTFEVDHPATQAAKRAALPHPRPHVRYVPVDFACDDLGAALDDADFVAPARTLVLWEGVTNYLDTASVDATFRFITRVTGIGSPVVFTYVDARMLTDPASFAGASQSTTRVRRQGEPFTFGLDPEAVSAHLDQYALLLRTDVAVPELVARYYGEHMDAYAYYHVVHAVRR